MQDRILSALLLTCLIGGTTMHGVWTLAGTVAQGDAIVQGSAAGLQLEGGFWRALRSTAPNDRIFSNGFDAPATTSGTQHRH